MLVFYATNREWLEPGMHCHMKLESCLSIWKNLCQPEALLRNFFSRTSITIPLLLVNAHGLFTALAQIAKSLDSWSLTLILLFTTSGQYSHDCLPSTYTYNHGGDDFDTGPAYCPFPFPEFMVQYIVQSIPDQFSLADIVYMVHLVQYHIQYRIHLVQSPLITFL